MKAVLLAAGRGSRLRPLTDVLPKCLMPVLGVPLLEIWLESLERMGVTDILVNTSYLAEEVEHFLTFNSRPIRVQIVREKELLGTAGTLFANRRFVRGSDVMVIHADNLSLFDPGAFVSAFRGRPAGCVGTMMSFDSDAPQTCGIIKTDAAGVVQEMFEKVKNPPGNRANGAVYIFSCECIEEIFAEPDCFDISTEILPRLMGRLNEFHNSEYHRDIGSVDLYRASCREVLEIPGFTRRFEARAWTQFAGAELTQGWERAWRECGIPLGVCAGLEDVPAALASRPQVVLIGQMRASEVPRLAELAAAHHAVTFIPWRVDAHA